MMALPAGVPSLIGSLESLFEPSLSFMTADTFDEWGILEPQWGIYLNGVPVVTADSVIAFDYKQDWSIADYPVERGGFESYDKVNTPYLARIQFASGGDETNRQALLDSIASIGDQLTLYDAVTPEEVYVGVNVSHYDYRRSARNGVGLIKVDVWLTEIREDLSANGNSPQSPSGAATQDQGTVQGSDATDGEIGQLSAVT